MSQRNSSQGGVPQVFMTTRECGTDQIFLPLLFSFGSAQSPRSALIIIYPTRSSA
jgi:hypothetical protein